MTQALALSFLALTFAVGLLRPTVALAILLCMFPMEQLLQANVPWFLANSSVFNVMCGSLAVVACLATLLRRPDSLSSFLNATSICVYSLFLFGAMSLLWTRNLAWAAEIVRNGTPYALVLLILAPLLVSRTSELQTLFKGVLVIGLLIAVQLMLNPNLELYTARLVFDIDESRKSNPLAIGTLGGTLLIVAMLVNFGPSAFWLGVRIAAVFGGLGLALLSGSRGQVMFAAIVIVLLYPVSRRIADYRRFFTTVAGFAVLGGASLLAVRFFISAENEDRWSVESLAYGGSGRWENAVDLISAWLREPQVFLTGFGYFSFEVLPNRSGDGYSHVMLADALGELGLIGFTLYVLVFAFAARSLIRLFAVHREDSLDRGSIAVLAALICYQFMLQNKQGTLFGVDTGWVYALIVARLAIRETREAELSTDPDPDQVRVAAEADASRELVGA